MRTLLLPTVRNPESRVVARPSQHRTRSKLTRSSTSSVDITAPLPSPTDTAHQWIGLPLHFDIVTDRLELEGYQIYAVEKWIVERDRPVTCLTVYTGDPAHKITVTALRPSASLSPEEATAEWDKAILHLRRDARPRETPHGLVLATSLAHFRSDYTIVQIPNGDFLHARDQLYTNINLLRIGCSGRSALTLEEPSDTTKDRFIATYHLPDNILSGAPSATANSVSPAPSPAPSPRPSPAKHRSRPSISSTNHRADNATPPPSQSTSREPASRRVPAGLHIASSASNYTNLSPSSATTPGGRIVPKSKARADGTMFSTSVLELVRLLQASLSIFGMFPADLPRLDGLLCDKTVEGLDRWVTDVGEHCVNIEATEGIADPAVVCALLSLVLATRNKLVAMGAYATPRDPFLRPQAFLASLAAPGGTPGSTAGTNTPATPAFPFLHGHGHSHILPTSPSSSTLVFAAASKPSAPLPSPSLSVAGVVLTRALLDAVGAAYSDKARAGERRRSRGARALLGFDGEASDGLSGGEVGSDGPPESGGGQILTGIGNLVGLNVGGGAAGGAAGVLEASVDLGAFVRVVVGRTKDRGKGRGGGKGRERDGRTGEGEDGEAKERDKEKEREKEIISGVAGCVRGLWSGLVWGVVALRERELEETMPLRRHLGGTPGRKDRFALVGSDGDIEETDLRIAKGEKDARSAEEEGAEPDKWGGRVQKKFESWTRLSRKKGLAGFDVSSGRDSFEDPSGPMLLRKRPPLPAHESTVTPMTFVRGDVEPGEEDLSSGQVSPIGGVEDPRTPKQFDLSATSSAANLVNAEKYDRKLSAFNNKRPWSTRLVQNRVSSWSDPVSAREILDADESEENVTGDGASDRARHPHVPRELTSSRLAQGSVLGDEDAALDEEPSDAAGYLSDVPPGQSLRRRTAAPELRRRRSWHQDFASFKNAKVLSPERMRIDVALCGQVLIMTRREEHLRHVLACVKVLTTSLSETNTRLREDYQAHVRALLEIEQQTQVIADIEGEGSKADKISQAQNTISYETQQLLVSELWHIASQPRHTTFALRDKVFGMGGRRLPPGKHGAHGRFNRLQWTLDGREYLVDYLGRTEGEAKEESVVEIEAFRLPPTDDEEELVKNPAMRPMWLLRFFTSWGAKWGANQPDADAKAKASSESSSETSESEPEDNKGVPSPMHVQASSKSL
ncbi:hypothetical protein GGX14DRAFT_692610 [Mycena pura]|uniref:STB6-like N-terminal domain-containing protein n=1 Tax=Mycena pura TaxID=153505 RepID=A0AAD6YT49_9AGAR|nr:hypothetical protein GGX14DRAFT_692610 [Mycena pura]